MQYLIQLLFGFFFLLMQFLHLLLELRIGFQVDSGDREYDSWHDLFLLQEHDGIIRAVYCTGGYRIAHIEGYAQVYQYPESLKKYF